MPRWLPPKIQHLGYPSPFRSGWLPIEQGIFEDVQMVYSKSASDQTEGSLLHEQIVLHIAIVRSD